MATIDLLGQTFGRLLVLGRALTPPKRREWYWLCTCTCGAQITAASSLLRNGTIKSCGCLRQEMGVTQGLSCRRHGESTNGGMTPEYRAWANMMSRCHNVRHQSYPNYGGRGISVSAQWDTFEAFLTDVGRRPSKAHSLDRVDNTADYGPLNWRWATPIEQNRNKRSNRHHTINNVTRTLAEWIALGGLDNNAVRQRIRTGMPIDEALTRPIRKLQRRAV